MKRFLWVIALSILSISAFAGKRIAVMVNAPTEDDAFVIESAICQQLDRDGRYDMLERTQEFMDMVVSEQVYQLSGEVTESQIAQLGERWGAQYVLAVTAKNINGSMRLVGKLIDIKTGRRLLTVNNFRKINNDNDLTFLSATFATNLEKSMKSKL